jgi:hypothetical protein
VTLDHGIFKVTMAPKDEPLRQVAVDLLERVARDYQAAGYPLKAPVRVLVQGAKGTNRSKYFHEPYNLVQLLPRPMSKESDFYHTVIHELAHWYHGNRVAGGFGNSTIREKYIHVMKSFRGTDQATVGTELDKIHVLIERARLKIEALESSVGLRRGVVVSVPGRENPFQGNVPYVRQYRVLKAPGRKTTRVELLNPSPWDLQMAQKNGWPLPLIREEATSSLLYHFQTESKKTELELARKEFEGLNEVRNSLVRGMREQGLRGAPGSYTEHLSDWIPTTYAKTNSHEWFAELLTAAILNPSTLKAEVQDWLRSVA